MTIKSSINYCWWPKGLFLGSFFFLFVGCQPLKNAYFSLTRMLESYQGSDDTTETLGNNADINPDTMKPSLKEQFEKSIREIKKTHQNEYRLPQLDPKKNLKNWLINRSRINSWGVPLNFLEVLNGYKVLIVKGFITDVYIGAGKLSPNTQLGKYFEDHLDLFRQLGVDAELATLDSFGAAQTNAASLAQVIRNYVTAERLQRRQAKPILLITHSKGGVDALEMLLDPNFINERKQVKAWLSLQTPFFGTPLADLVEQNALAKKISMAAFESSLPEKLRARTQEFGLSFLSMTEKIRFAFMKKNRAAINLLTEQMSIISMGSYVDQKPELAASEMGMPSDLFSGLTSEQIAQPNWYSLEPPRITPEWYTLFGLGFQLIRKLGYANDMLVPIGSSVLPGSPYVIYRNVDHAAPAMHCYAIPDFDAGQRKIMMLTLLDALLMNRK